MSDMKKTVEKLISEETGCRSRVSEITKLHGDASYRTYYRAAMADGATFIVMQMPEGRSSASEEITNFKGAHEELPFINVARFLSGLGLPVPAIHHYSQADRLMILEDLGDEIMAKKVESAGEDVRLEWYTRALELLITMQRRTSDNGPRTCIALARSFDATLLNWEFDHFREYCVEARQGKEMETDDRETFERETRKISAAIEAMPYGFTHRDFQSRNLIIKGKALYLIDFQDALTGPKVYDLVALTRDSYVKLADSTVDHLVRAYAAEVGRDPSVVRREFDLVTVQRKLKDAGRFVYIDRVKKNPDFLKYIPTSLGYVRRALERLPEYAGLKGVIEKYLPDWS